MRNVATKQSAYKPDEKLDNNDDNRGTKKTLLGGMRNRSQGELLPPEKSAQTDRNNRPRQSADGKQDSADLEQVDLNLMQARDPRNSQFGNSVFKDSCSVAALDDEVPQNHHQSHHQNDAEE